MPKINIAIDGPAGSGKTTLGREFAQRINYQFLDSGLFYRYFAKILNENGYNSSEKEKVIGRAAALLGRPAHDPLTDLDTQIAHNIIGMADAEAHPQFLRLLIQQENGEHLIIRSALHHLSNTHHQLVEIERGIDAFAYLAEQSQNLR